MAWSHTGQRVAISPDDKGAVDLFELREAPQLVEDTSCLFRWGLGGREVGVKVRVALPLNPIDKGNTATKVGEVGVVQQPRKLRKALSGKRG